MNTRNPNSKDRKDSHTHYICIDVHFANEWAVCLPTGPELGNGLMGGFLTQRELKGGCTGSTISHLRAC